ncbi:hypothetical protein AGDE_13509 [Angomonas deanei]|uniref:VHS domain containing protein, putative n=1 Tax=Angomonas deanei TaxID=59799 RepID=A0A7G2C011_9TRYP|nr:hypothetical protein AGDE_13509 [Angomonas deanei]CAD2213099.1 VHS domain containing protein, putative [Angomonas deanei]|eukprot:EPY22226.1 hypothetical protein AGDE_13509 [Angomonas deanei]
MIHLSFFEEVKDKAARLIPTAYMEIVEECTAPNLSVPTYDHVNFLCKSVNKNPDCIVDVVRALRRRVVDDNPSVQYLTVLLLESMIKSCHPPFHVEVASQKGMLRDLELLASDPPKISTGMRAREAALALILNLSVWFAGHPDPRCHILATMANDVRVLSGPNAFTGVTPDTNTRIITENFNPGPPGQRATKKPAERRPLVDAICINLPTDEMISGMLDACVAFSEYLQNAGTLPDGTVRPDEVIVGFQDKIRQDHEYISILLSSNLKVDRDVLRSISDSQSAVLASMSTTKGEAKKEQVHMEAAPQPPQATTEPTAPPPAATKTANTTVDDLFGGPQSNPPPMTKMDPTPDEIFDSVAHTQQRDRTASLDVNTDTFSPSNSVVVPVDTPSVVENFRAENAAAAAAVPAVAPPAPVEHFDPFADPIPAVDSVPEMANPSSSPVVEEAQPEPSFSPREGGEREEEVVEEPAAENPAPAAEPVEEAPEEPEAAAEEVKEEEDPFGEPVVVTPEKAKEESEATPAAAPAPAADDDDDFDAFLNGRSP